MHLAVLDFRDGVVVCLDTGDSTLVFETRSFLDFGESVHYVLSS